MFERLARLPVDVEIASEFRYREPALAPGALAIVISQSGETADTLAALRWCQGARACHTPPWSTSTTSTMAREAETVLPTYAGPEIGVASTKAFTCQLTVLTALAVAAGTPARRIDDAEEARLVDGSGRNSAADRRVALGIETADRRASPARSPRHATCSTSAAARAIRWRWRAR